MNSPLSVEAYRHLLRAGDRDEDAAAAAVALADAELAAADRFDALKAAVRRKRKRPPAALLVPLDLTESPQHTHRDQDDDSDDDRHQHQPGLWTPLPPLVVNVLERKRLFLSPSGDPVVGVEEILQLQELPASPPRRLRASPLQLIAVPRKVFEDDEVALMPCHSLHYRYVPSLEVEKWKEPVRDRDKHWRDDELAMILATRGLARGAAETKMTRGVPGSNARRGTWRKLDSQRLQIKSSQSTRTALGAVPETAALAVAAATTATTAAAPASPRDVSQPGEVMLRVQGAMISRTYCVVTIHGVGIYGRLYSEGLADRKTDRFLRIDAYAPATSATSSLRVSLADLEWVFEAHPDLLAPGHKQTVLTKVVSLLYFAYPEDDEGDTGDELSLPSPRAPPVLCISPDEKLNEAARRRLEREERLRREEAERLRLLALLMGLPRRARHRVAVKLTRVSGHTFLVSVYHFPTQVRNLLVVAYHPRSSRTLTLAVGVQEAASLSGVATPPHKWTPALKTQVATALLPRLRLRGAKPTVRGGDDATSSASGDLARYRVALAIREDRVGAQGAWLALPLPAHDGARQLEVVAKFKKDGQQELTLALERQLAELEHDAAAKRDALRGEIARAEAALVALDKRDAELQQMIEDINSGKGMAALSAAAVAAEEAARKQETQHQHERRRGHKAARKTLKDERKALQARVVAWRRELDVTHEHLVLERDRAQTTSDRALDALTQRAVTATLPLWFDPLTDRRAPLAHSQRSGNHQRRRLLRGEIGDATTRSLASGACQLGGRRMRFSVFQELPPHVVKAPRVKKPPVDGDVDAEEQEEEEQEEEEEEDAAEEEPPSPEAEWFQLSFYDASTSCAWPLRLSRLEWLALTKSQHDAQLAVAALRVPTSSAVQQVEALDASYEATRQTLVALKPLKKNDKTRRQLLDELRKNRVARRALWTDQAPWPRVVRALCERLTLSTDDGDGLVLDRCLYRATLDIVSLAENGGGGEDADADADGVVECEVWVTQLVDVVRFHARGKATGEQWALAYPDSAELVKEFAVETQLELQLHLEAIATTLLLYTDNSGGQDGGEEGDDATMVPARMRKMRFEE